MSRKSVQSSDWLSKNYRENVEMSGDLQVGIDVLHTSRSLHARICNFVEPQRGLEQDRHRETLVPRHRGRRRCVIGEGRAQLQEPLGHCARLRQLQCVQRGPDRFGGDDLLQLPAADHTHGHHRRGAGVRERPPPPDARWRHGLALPLSCVQARLLMARREAKPRTPKARTNAAPMLIFDSYASFFDVTPLAMGRGAHWSGIPGATPLPFLP